MSADAAGDAAAIVRLRGTGGFARSAALALAGCSALMPAAAFAAQPATHDAAEPATSHRSSPVPIATAPPAGFEDIQTRVETRFDLMFEGRDLGSFPAAYEHGRLRFGDPAAVVRALGAEVDAERVAVLLAQPLPANERYRCPPGQGAHAGCGFLPAGMSGIIVNADTFHVALFLAQSFLVAPAARQLVLGPPISGPSLIQGARFSLSANDGPDGRVRYGGTFDTIASIGRTSLVAQTYLTDLDGLESQELYVQRIWKDRRAAAGILQDDSALAFTNFRIVGGEIGSFYDMPFNRSNETSTPVQIVLPRRAQVEIYRDALLLSTGQYEAGLQLLDTANLPRGSYTIHIVARDGGNVLLDEHRAFTKLSGLPPPGKLAFRFRAGERMQDNFATTVTSQRAGFFAPTTGEFVTSTTVERRLGNMLAGSLHLATFDDRVFGEASAQIFRGRVQGIVAAGVGSDNTWSALVSGSVDFQRISFFLSARSTHSDATIARRSFDPRSYYPLFRSENSIFASMQARVLGGSLTLSGNYTAARGLPARATVSLQHTSSIRVPGIGSALLNVGGSVSDFDRRVGISLSFFRRVSHDTQAVFTGGGQYVSSSRSGSREGFSPEAQAVLTQSSRIGTVDVTRAVGASTDADSDRVFGQVRAASDLGLLDATGQYQTHTYSGGTLAFLMNAQTGFAIGGGAVKLGLRDPASAMLLVDIDPADAPAAAPAPATDPARVVTVPGDQTGGYRVTINNRPRDFLRPGTRAAIGVMPLDSYQLGLNPEGAPPFDIDGDIRQVPVYPGNVVRVRFSARRVATVYGQVTEPGGAALRGARIEAGSDYGEASDEGFFVITGPIDATLSIKRADGSLCVQAPLASFVPADAKGALYRIGKLACAAPPVR